MLNEPAYQVDVVIAVHSADRPIERAVGSVLNHTKAAVRVTVVAHNISAEQIASRLGKYSHDPRLRIFHLDDGILSPAGPKNMGLDYATAQFVSLLDSDDQFEPGAIDGWLKACFRLAKNPREGADVVIASRRRVPGRFLSHPIVRCGKTRNLDGVKDRLVYRTGVTGGLISRKAFGHLRFTEGLRVGEDMLYSASLWFSGADVVFDAGSPSYLEHSDQNDRVTGETISVTEEFRYLENVLAPENVWMRNSSMRLACTVKLMRVHVLGRLRKDKASRTSDEMIAIVRRLYGAEPRLPRFLSRSDLAVLSEVSGATQSAPHHVLRDRPARYSWNIIEVLVPGSRRETLHLQGPFRMRLGQAFLQVRLVQRLAFRRTIERARSKYSDNGSRLEQ